METTTPVTKRVNITLTRAEFEQLDAEARRDNLSLLALIEDRALGLSDLRIRTYSGYRPSWFYSSPKGPISLRLPANLLPTEPQVHGQKVTMSAFIRMACGLPAHAAAPARVQKATEHRKRLIFRLSGDEMKAVVKDAAKRGESAEKYMVEAITLSTERLDFHFVEGWLGIAVKSGRNFVWQVDPEVMEKIKVDSTGNPNGITGVIRNRLCLKSPTKGRRRDSTSYSLEAKEPGDLEVKMLSVAVTKGQYEYLDSMAQDQGMSVTGYARSVLGLKQKRFPKRRPSSQKPWWWPTRTSGPILMKATCEDHFRIAQEASSLEVSLSTYCRMQLGLDRAPCSSNGFV